MSDWKDKLPPIFAECVGESLGRYTIDRPFRHGDHIYSTNGKIIVRTKAENYPEFVNEVPDGTGTSPNPDGLFVDGQHQDTAVDLPDVSHMDDDEVCDTCGGSGLHICGRCENEHVCGGCNGNGRNKTCFAIPIPGGAKPLRMQFVKLLRKYGARVYPPINPKHPYRFVTDDGCEGLVMGMEATSHD